MLGVVSDGATKNHPLGDETHSVEETEAGFCWIVTFQPTLHHNRMEFSGREPTKDEADQRVNEVRLVEWNRRKLTP